MAREGISLNDKSALSSGQKKCEGKALAPSIQLLLKSYIPAVLLAEMPLFTTIVTTTRRFCAWPLRE